MKKKISITKKLFFVTTALFLVFIGSTLLIQSLFFEKFYISKKKSDLISGVEKLRDNYNKAENDEKKAALIEEYETSYNGKVVILDSSRKIKFVPRPQGSRLDSMRVRELSDFISTWSGKIDNKTLALIIEKKEIKAKDLIIICPNNKGEVIFSISSLQPVNEAVAVIKQLYLYFAIGAVFFIILLSLVYSNMITKPLIMINKTATKMAKLDFSEKCVVYSEDEIGSLAASLNFLSENLDNSLTSLREANKKLEKDIEKERELEKMRKEFIASVSHELKTPISLIDGYALGLKDNIFEGQGKD